MKITLIDCYGVCHTVKHALKKNEEFMNEFQDVGIIFGFLNKLLKYSKKIPTDRFVFAWDSLQSKRKEKYPIYKSKEKPELDEFDKLAFKQFNQLREEVLPEMGFQNILFQEGYEGDDMIGDFVKNNLNKKITIITSDNDISQLLSPKVSIYHIRNDKFLTEKMFIKKNKIEPSKWAKVKSLAGDFGKNLDGVPGVGNANAISYLNGTLPSSGKAYKNIISGEYDFIVKRNEELLTLPLKGVSRKKLKDEYLYFSDFLKVFNKFDFGYFTTSERSKEWFSNFSC